MLGSARLKEKFRLVRGRDGDGPGRAPLDPDGFARPTPASMNLPDDEQVFLRDLVKASRQKAHAVEWIDRDGSKRVTVLTPAEATRLNTLAHREGMGKSELLRQAAHIPVAKVRPGIVPPG